MSINPPSDILLDVVRAADPAKSAMATERLSRLAADRGTADTQFADVFSDAKAPGQAPLAAIASPRFANETPEKARDIAETKAYQGIGALLLGSLVENMLPESDEFFGEEAGAGMWRSMLAQELGTKFIEDSRPRYRTEARQARTSHDASGRGAAHGVHSPVRGQTFVTTHGNAGFLNE